MSDTATSNPHARSRLTLIGAGLILVAGLIHLFLTPEHFREAPYLGLLFFANFIGAAVAAFGLYRGRRWGWMLGALVAGGAFVTYLVSGSVGLPGVGRGHSLQPVDVFTKMVEALFLVLWAYRLMGFRRWVLAGSVVTILLVTGTATALGLQGGHGDHGQPEGGGGNHGGSHAGGHGHGDSNEGSATAAEQEAAEKLVGDTEAGAARFEDFEVAREEGYQLMRGKRGKEPGPSRPRHFLNTEYVEDGEVLDPERPEGLMYMETSDGGMALIGVMYVALRGEGPPVGGDLTQWHTHDRLCIGYDETGAAVVSLRVRGCSGGSSPVSDIEMLHVWLFGHPDGPLAPHLKPKDARAMRDAEL